MAYMLGSAQDETTLFDDHDTANLTAAERRTIRRRALGGALAFVRTGRRWTVNDAASAAGLAPMTWRRLEDGLEVRQRSHSAVDNLLGLPFGTVKRALADDVLMVDLVAATGAVERATVPDHEAGTFLASYADRVTTGTVRAPRPWPVVDDETRRSLLALSMHVPATRPTPLDSVTRMVEVLAPLAARSEAIAEAVRAAAAAIPDVIAHQVVEAGAECTADQERG